ncbi:MAG: acyl-CoA dehydrogenase family protein [Actinomycetota bacterium]|nr:acyl-CoA dehydrogenase family protein [Actinomycetota bacterium]
MNYFFSEEQEMVRDLARKIALDKVVPRRAELDEKEEFPFDIMEAIGKADLFGLYIPEEYGGLGMGSFETLLVVEELSRGCCGVSVSYAASALGAYPILLFGSDEQKKRILPGLASGEKLGAFGLTEAGAGSDASAIKMTAKKDGDNYVLNGTKQWITNGGVAEIYTIIAMTDKNKGSRGASAFIVEANTPGFSIGKKEKKMGIRSSITTELIFEDCKIPSDNLIGKEGLGFIITMKTLDMTRPGIGAQGVGLAQGALEAALDFASKRIQFDQSILNLQAVQHIFADMATEIEAARALVYATARTIDAGEKNFSKESAMAKRFATDVAMKVSIDAVQMMGGHGYMREYPVEKMMRDAKVLQIYEGTNQIQRNVIASQLVKEIMINNR